MGDATCVVSAREFCPGAAGLGITLRSVPRFAGVVPSSAANHDPSLNDGPPIGEQSCTGCGGRHAVGHQVALGSKVMDDRAVIEQVLSARQRQRRQRHQVECAVWHDEDASRVDKMRGQRSPDSPAQRQCRACGRTVWIPPLPEDS